MQYCCFAASLLARTTEQIRNLKDMRKKTVKDYFYPPQYIEFENNAIQC